MEPIDEEGFHDLADLEDTDYGSPNPERDQRFLARLNRIAPTDADKKRLLDAVRRVIGQYQGSPLCDHFMGELTEDFKIEKARLFL